MLPHAFMAVEHQCATSSTWPPSPRANTIASWPLSMTASSKQESHVRSHSSPSCAASSSTQTPSSDQATLGNVPRLLDNRHGRFRARTFGAPRNDGKEFFSNLLRTGMIHGAQFPATEEDHPCAQSA